MAYPTITDEGGTVHTFLTIGVPEAEKERVETWRRPGVAGTASRLMGKAGSSQRFEARVDVTAANPTALQVIQDAFTALKGQIVVLVDNMGKSNPNMLIEEVEIPAIAEGNPRVIATPAGGVEGSDATHMFTVFFTMVRKTT